jgi:hypothetical protein
MEEGDEGSTAGAAAEGTAGSRHHERRPGGMRTELELARGLGGGLSGRRHAGTRSRVGPVGNQEDGTDDDHDHGEDDEDVEPEQDAPDDVDGPAEGPSAAGAAPVEADISLGQDQSGIVEVGQRPQVVNRR